jgi:hypothetical protein
MGKLINGIAGGMTGKVGNMVYYMSGGINIARRIGKRVAPVSAPEQINRCKMKVVTGFIKPVLEVVRLGFGTAPRKKGCSAYHMAVSYNRINAVAGVYPDFEMDFSKVLLSNGNLTGAIAPQVELVVGGLRFTWLYSPEMLYPREHDRAIMLAYFPDSAQFVYVLDGPDRAKGTGLLPVPFEMLVLRMEVYVSFVSTDGLNVAVSSYLGRIN